MVSQGIMGVVVLAARSREFSYESESRSRLAALPTHRSHVSAGKHPSVDKDVGDAQVSFHDTTSAYVAVSSACLQIGRASCRERV